SQQGPFLQIRVEALTSAPAAGKESQGFAKILRKESPEQGSEASCVAGAPEGREHRCSRHPTDGGGRKRRCEKGQEHETGEADQEGENQDRVDTAGAVEVKGGERSGDAEQNAEGDEGEISQVPGRFG